MGYLFDALTGKIGHFNSINRPIDNGIASRIRELAKDGKPDESGEILLITFAFGMTQEVVGDLFYPDNGLFRKLLSSIIKEELEAVYYTIMDLSLSKIISLPLNINKEKLVKNFAEISESTVENKTKDIEIYSKSSTLEGYKIICQHLKINDNAQGAVIFHSSFMKAFEGATAKLNEIIYGQ